METTVFETWFTEFQQFRLPLWEDFPDLELYMDQVIIEVNKQLVPLLQAQTTKTMINSYVKMGIIEHPIKKRYTRNHLAEIIVVSIMKLVFPLDTVKSGINQALSDDNVITAYNHFVALFNSEIMHINQPSSGNEFTLQESTLMIAQKVAVKSVIYKIIGINLVELDHTATII